MDQTAMTNTLGVPDGEALTLEALFDAWENAAHAQLDAFDPATVIRTHEAFVAELIYQYVDGTLISRSAEPVLTGVVEKLAKLRETFCYASPGSDAEFTSLLLGFDAAAAVVTEPYKVRDLEWVEELDVRGRPNWVAPGLVWSYKIVLLRSGKYCCYDQDADDQYDTLEEAQKFFQDQLEATIQEWVVWK